MARIRQSRPDSVHGFQVKNFKPAELFPLRSDAAWRQSIDLFRGIANSGGAACVFATPKSGLLTVGSMPA